MKWEVKQKEKIYHGAIIGKKEFEKIHKKVKNDRNTKEKIYGYDFVDGKYQVNEKEATNIRNRIEKEVDTAKKEEKRRKANKSRSEKMKALWENEDYKKQMTERIKIAKKLKKLRER